MFVLGAFLVFVSLSAGTSFMLSWRWRVFGLCRRRNYPKDGRHYPEVVWVLKGCYLPDYQGVAGMLVNGGTAVSGRL